MRLKKQYAIFLPRVSGCTLGGWSDTRVEIERVFQLTLSRSNWGTNAFGESAKPDGDPKIVLVTRLGRQIKKIVGAECVCDKCPVGLYESNL